MHAGRGGVQAGPVQPLDVRHRADTDQDEIGVDRLAVVENDSFDPVGSFEVRHGSSADETDPVVPRKIAENRRDRGAEIPGEGDLGDLDDRDVDTRCARRCRDLESDEPATDDDQVAARAQPLPQEVGVGERAQGEDAVGGLRERIPWPGAGGDHEVVELDLAQRRP